MPNFLIVGAAKSGTTSLYNYLSIHPDIFMPPTHKEPRFFVAKHFKNLQAYSQKFKEHIQKMTIDELFEYESLFSKARDKTLKGEASVAYLYFYQTAIPNILKYAGDIKIIIILRNPIDRAYSAYSHFKRDLNEPLSFEEALASEASRIEKNYLPLYRYIDQGMYADQVEAYLKNFSNVHILLFDDLIQNRLESIQRIYKFLNVDAQYIPDNIENIFNESGSPKSKFLQQFIYNDSHIKLVIKNLVPKNIKTRLKKLNLKKATMKNETREFLKAHYKEDILLTQSIIKRDLSSWLK
jgi:hypothetical protein